RLQTMPLCSSYKSSISNSPPERETQREFAFQRRDVDSAIAVGREGSVRWLVIGASVTPRLFFSKRVSSNGLVAAPYAQACRVCAAVWLNPNGIGSQSPGLFSFGMVSQGSSQARNPGLWDGTPLGFVGARNAAGFWQAFNRVFRQTNEHSGFN